MYFAGAERSAGSDLAGVLQAFRRLVLESREWDLAGLRRDQVSARVCF